MISLYAFWGARHVLALASTGGSGGSTLGTSNAAIIAAIIAAILASIVAPLISGYFASRMRPGEKRGQDFQELESIREGQRDEIIALKADVLRLNDRVLEQDKALRLAERVALQGDFDKQRIESERNELLRQSGELTAARDTLQRRVDDLNREIRKAEIEAAFALRQRDEMALRCGIPLGLPRQTRDGNDAKD